MIHLQLVPVDGDPVAVRELASNLTAGAARLADINAGLASIRAGADWESPAGETFQSLVQASPPLLDALMRRYALSAEALRAFAVDLEGAQLQDQTARRRLAEACAEERLLEHLATLNTGNPEATLQIDKRRREVADRVFEIQALHQAATREFGDADQRLARRLRALADDVLDDPWHYRAVATVDETAAAISLGVSSLGDRLPVGDALFSMLPGGAQLTAGTATATAVSGAALKVIYGEGSWKQVGVNTLGSLKVTGKAFKMAGVAGSNPASKLLTKQRTYTGTKISTTGRLRQGAREAFRESTPTLAKFVDPRGALDRTVVPLSAPKMAALKGLPLAEKTHAMKTFLTAKVVHTADVKFLDGWRAASAGGDNAKKLFVAGTILEKAEPKITKGANQALEGKPEEKGSAPTYP